MKKQFTLLDMSGYQWLVLLAAWLGWGFDVFDSLLFNYVSGNCVPTLLGLKLGSPEANAAVPVWTGIVTSLLLVGWGLGGILFGRYADKIGRTRTLMFTMLLYSVGTAACAASQNIWMLMAFRFVASLGIGGEWAAGASMVAEVVPEKRRVEAGALLYTAAPLGLFLATFITYRIQNIYFVGNPESSWRYVFMFGLLPAAIALIVRAFVKEPERWKETSGAATHPRIRELFTPELRRLTFSGLAMAVVALLTWWSCNSFLPLLGEKLAEANGKAQGLAPAALKALKGEWKAHISTMFNMGGLIGTLATIPFANRIGRKPMFGCYYLLAAISIFVTFFFDFPPEYRMAGAFVIGLTVFGVFGSFTYYLPELFPTRLRATGAGFCYNTGRFVTAGGPFLVGLIAKGGLQSLLMALSCVAIFPAIGVLAMPLVIETKGSDLSD